MGHLALVNGLQYAQSARRVTIGLKEYSVVESSDSLEEAAQIYYNT